MYSFGQFLDELFNGLMEGDFCAIVVVVITMALIGYVGYEIYWHATYKRVLSEEKQDKGIVTDMSYTSATSYMAGKVHTTTPEQHNVYILAEKLGKIHFDREKLYQTVRIDDEVTIKYRDVIRVRRDNPRDSVVVDHDITAIISPKGREVEI